MSAITRVLAGALGGLIATASKILAMDIGQLDAFLMSGDFEAASQLRVTLYIICPILVFLGAALAWASRETKPMTLLSIGCAAPALIAPWTTGNLAGQPSGGQAWNGPAIVSSAYAQESADQITQDTGKVSAFQYLFGLKDESDLRYWVIVGSYKDLQKAYDYRDVLNEADPTIKAFVGKQKPGNPYYPIIVGGEQAFLPIDEAKALKEKAQTIPIVPGDVYLSNYAGRLPQPAVQ
ncbi:MAG: hypothetical protein OIF56_03465 [Cohaesibacter sp.]|nr:hypothetical protein [Cohaesibacter sp.]